MHKDYKAKRAALREMQERRFRPEKRVDQEAIAKFRGKPYALVYAEKLKELKKNNDVTE